MYNEFFTINYQYPFICTGMLLEYVYLHYSWYIFKHYNMYINIAQP